MPECVIECDRLCSAGFVKQSNLASHNRCLQAIAVWIFMSAHPQSMPSACISIIQWATQCWQMLCFPVGRHHHPALLRAAAYDSGSRWSWAERCSPSWRLPRSWPAAALSCWQFPAAQHYLVTSGYARNTFLLGLKLAGEIAYAWEICISEVSDEQAT